jgi:hypothetical protein
MSLFLVFRGHTHTLKGRGFRVAQGPRGKEDFWVLVS